MVKKQVVATLASCSSSRSSSSSNKNEAVSSTAATFKYTGVRKRKWGKWVSEIRLPNSRERIWLGSYDSAVKAARAFDAAQFCLRGRSANFNFPDNPPEIAGGRSMTPAEIQVAASKFANTYVDVSQHEDTGCTDTNTETDTEITSYSPSVSDGATTMGQVESGSSEVAGIESSFYDQLRLNSTIGSGNFVSEFGYFSTGYDEYNPGGYYCPPPENIECDREDLYDASIYQESFLWNF